MNMISLSALLICDILLSEIWNLVEVEMATMFMCV